MAHKNSCCIFTADTWSDDRPAAAQKCHFYWGVVVENHHHDHPTEHCHIVNIISSSGTTLVDELTGT